MQHTITGTTMPVLEITLQPGEQLVAEAGELSWISPGIDMRTATSIGGSGGGVFGALKRAVAGGTLFMTEYTAREAGEVAFAAKVPGHIVQVDVDAQHDYRVHRHGFLCGDPTVALEVAFQQRFKAGLFGGAGFSLQRLTGHGVAFVELSGELIERDLQPGQPLRVHPGHVGMFEGSVSFQIVTIPGVKNKFFGGDGLFLAELHGPGRVWLQTLPLANLAHALAPYMPAEESN